MSEKCPLCDGEIYVDKFNHTIWCNGMKHEFLCINNSNCSRKAVEIDKNIKQ